MTKRVVVLAAIAFYIGAAVGIYHIDDMEEVNLLLVWILMIPVSSARNSFVHPHSGCI